VGRGAINVSFWVSLWPLLPASRKVFGLVSLAEKTFTFTVLALFAAVAIAHAEEPTPSERIVKFYEADRCLEIESQYHSDPRQPYGPVVRAVIAGCLQKASEADALFEGAERERPNNQVILILHARYLRKTNPDKAMNLWAKVRLYARSESIKRMAEDYLSGVIDIQGEEERLSIGPKTIGWLYSQAGEAYTSNPGLETLGGSTSSQASWGNNVVLRGRIKDETSWGDYGAQVSTSAATYYSNHYNDSYTSRLDLPVGVDSGDFGSVVFTPFAAHELRGYSSYHTSWGFGVMGVALSDTYRQSVQAIMYRDQFYDPTAQTQAGDHVRFEYDWLLYPDGKEIFFGTFIEHVHARVDNEDSDQSSVNFSHNDIGLLGSFLLKGKFIGFSVGPTFTYRQDTNDSFYFINGLPVTKRRHDLDLDVRVAVGLPLERSSRVELFYDFNEVFSNFGQLDVQNYNLLNRIYGLNVDLQVDWL